MCFRPQLEHQLMATRENMENNWQKLELKVLVCWWGISPSWRQYAFLFHYDLGTAGLSLKFQIGLARKKEDLTHSFLSIQFSIRQRKITTTTKSFNLSKFYCSCVEGIPLYVLPFKTPVCLRHVNQGIGSHCQRLSSESLDENRKLLYTFHFIF